MRVESQSTGRVLGYVQVQVASRTYALRVEALPPKNSDDDRREPGFFEDDNDGYGIFVDGEASPTEVDQTIEKASLDATRHISRKVLN